MQNHYCNLYVESQTDHAQSNIESCKIDLTQKYTFEVIKKVQKHLYQMNPHF